MERGRAVYIYISIKKTVIICRLIQVQSHSRNLRERAAFLSLSLGEGRGGGGGGVLQPKRIKERGDSAF